MSRKLGITYETKQLIVKSYLSGLNSNQCGRLFGCSGTTVLRILAEQGIQRRTSSEASRVYQIEDDFFDEIDTEEKAYFFGMLMADGTNRTQKNEIDLRLQENDQDILLKLRNLIFKEERPLLPVPYENPKHKDQLRLLICNKHISEQLSLLGCVRNKTHRVTYPHWLDPKLDSHFIRGYFDGDGSIFTAKRSIFQVVFTIVGTQAFCEAIQRKFAEIGIESRVDKSRTTYAVTVTNRKRVFPLMAWLYKDSKIYMERKFLKYHEIKSRIDEIQKVYSMDEIISLYEYYKQWRYVAKHLGISMDRLRSIKRKLGLLSEAYQKDRDDKLREKLISLWSELGSWTQVAKLIGMSREGLCFARKRLGMPMNDVRGCI
jgi:hypothetical protein